MKTLLLCGALCALSALPVLAQTRAQPAPGAGGAVFQLPPSVKNVVSIDAHNLLIIESERNGQTQYTTSLVKHVYSGGIARVFGGTVVPTAVFVSPVGAQFAQNIGGGTGTGVAQAGGANLGGNGFGGNGGFNNGGFNNGGFNNGAITRQNFTGNGGFSLGPFNGTLATNNGTVNLQVRPR